MLCLLVITGLNISFVVGIISFRINGNVNADIPRSSFLNLNPLIISLIELSNRNSFFQEPSISLDAAVLIFKNRTSNVTNENLRFQSERRAEYRAPEEFLPNPGLYSIHRLVRPCNGNEPAKPYLPIQPVIQ